MEKENITHFILLRPESPLIAMFQQRAWKHVGMSGKPLPALACLSLEVTGQYVLAEVRWQDVPGSPSTQKLHIPHSEVLLLIDAAGSDPQQIGFLREE
jgi:hypothetical protein